MNEIVEVEETIYQVDPEVERKRQEELEFWSDPCWEEALNWVESLNDEELLKELLD
jgi:hypothetical protein